jgi:hypothetical protein
MFATPDCSDCQLQCSPLCHSRLVEDIRNEGQIEKLGQGQGPRGMFAPS